MRSGSLSSLSGPWGTLRGMSPLNPEDIPIPDVVMDIIRINYAFMICSGSSPHADEAMREDMLQKLRDLYPGKYREVRTRVLEWLDAIAWEF